jgi:hypothetical protein
VAEGDVRGRYAGAGIEMADHSADLVVHQFLRDDSRGPGIGLIVFADQFEMRFAPADHNTLCIGIVYRHACTILIVLAQVCLRSGQWR